VRASPLEWRLRLEGPLPQAALYYPDWSVTDSRFLFESLIYWDRLACIVPFEGFEHERAIPGAGQGDADFTRALRELNERFVTGIVPTPEQQGRVHERLQFFIERDPPEWCRPENLQPERRTVFSAWKFSEPTIGLLREHGWIRGAQGAEDPLKLQSIADAAANILLAELAEECGSETLPPITSDAGSFRASCNTLLFELGAPAGLGADALEHPEQSEDDDLAFVLCSVTRLGLGDHPVTGKELKRLYELRMDTGFDEQRGAFCEKVDGYVRSLRAAAPNERQLVIDNWRVELERDRKGLRKELRSAGFRSLIDKEGLIALFLGGGGTAILGPIGAAIGVTAAAARAVVRSRQLRGEALEQHWTSWLFSIERPRLALW
jgi:hypothetical protein